jgi:hypothetical protein
MCKTLIAMPDVLRTPLRKERQLWSLRRNSRHACFTIEKGIFPRQQPVFVPRNLPSSTRFRPRGRSKAKLNANRLRGTFLTLVIFSVVGLNV